MVPNPARNDSPISLPAYRPLLRVRGRYPCHVIVLGRVHTWLMHWDDLDKRTMPCLMGECVHCQQFVSRRPLSYLAVAHVVQSNESVSFPLSVLEVPLATGIEIQKLHGALVRLQRLNAKGPISVYQWVSKITLPNLSSFDIVPPLMRLWRVSPNRQLVLLDDSTWSMWSVANA